MQNNTFSTLFVGQNFIKLKEVDSTNNYLKNLASNSEPLPEGTVIMADNQFAGRGQQESIWQTESGKNISMSVYLKPSFLPLNKQFFLNMAVSLAVAESLSSFLPSAVKVKWPNDIYYDGKKIGGILIENTLTGTTIKSAIVGIGLNINQEQFAGNLAESAISVFQILHKQINLNLIIEKMLIGLEKYYLNLRAAQYRILQKNYLNRLLNFNTIATFNQNGQVFEGTIKGVEDNGLLIMGIGEKTVTFNFKEIEYLHTKINTP